MVPPTAFHFQPSQPFMGVVEDSLSQRVHSVLRWDTLIFQSGILQGQWLQIISNVTQKCPPMSLFTSLVSLLKLTCKHLGESSKYKMAPLYVF